MRRLFALWAIGTPGLANAAFDGSQLGSIWALPFVGMLASIALMPLLLPKFWHHHFGKVALFWTALFVLPFCWGFGVEETAHQVAHTMLVEYIPFIAIVFALYTVAGGIGVQGSLRATPAMNTGLLTIGTLLASWTGTTGAAMLMVRPVIRANAGRPRKAHVLVFFIFLVANIGGALTPLGDPPLFLGFLKGVNFFWTTEALLGPTVLCAGLVLAIFYGVDSYFFRKDSPGEAEAEPFQTFRIVGARNFLLLGAVLACVLLSAVWKPGIAWQVLGSEWALENIARDAMLIGIGVLSLAVTPQSVRADNDFNWGPIQEVGKLFLGIFLTIIPVIAMLRAGEHGPLGGIVHAVSDSAGQPINMMYFWLCGALSSVLDNAPTYLVFFNMASGDPAVLMGERAGTLLAISAGAVFMGAMTYIGNAPNFMVKAIAEDRGIAMPSFFGYVLWSGAVLLPVFGLMSWIYF